MMGKRVGKPGVPKLQVWCIAILCMLSCGQDGGELAENRLSVYSEYTKTWEDPNYPQWKRFSVRYRVVNNSKEPVTFRWPPHSMTHSLGGIETFYSHPAVVEYFGMNNEVHGVVVLNSKEEIVLEYESIGHAILGKNIEVVPGQLYSMEEFYLEVLDWKVESYFLEHVPVEAEPN